MKKFITLVVLFMLLYTTLNSGTTQKIWAPMNSYTFKPSTTTPAIIVDPKQHECLAMNIYFEAAIESTAGKLAVAQVTLNRVKSRRYPNTICSVVKEGQHYASGFPKRDRCQFSWYCDGKHDNPRETPAWRASQDIAKYVMTTPDLIDITDGSTHYHANYIPAPRWADPRKKTVAIDTHIFYNKSSF
tara:strand:+ start:208 stop:768 length:561 start_codon:yes stop_codon:yes gene_type:complete